MVVAHVILVSALGPNPSFFLFWGTFIQLGGLLGQGPGLGLGPGLDNKCSALLCAHFNGNNLIKLSLSQQVRLAFKYESSM